MSMFQDINPAYIYAQVPGNFNKFGAETFGNDYFGQDNYNEYFLIKNLINER